MFNKAIIRSELILDLISGILFLRIAFLIFSFSKCQLHTFHKLIWYKKKKKQYFYYVLKLKKK
jgi:hypothetical protein